MQIILERTSSIPYHDVSFYATCTISCIASRAGQKVGRLRFKALGECFFYVII